MKNIFFSFVNIWNFIVEIKRIMISCKLKKIIIIKSVLFKKLIIGYSKTSALKYMMLILNAI